jgi:hypothetical protein
MRLPRVFLVTRSLASAPSAAATDTTCAAGAETAPPRDGRGERARSRHGAVGADSDDVPYRSRLEGE